MAGPVVSGVPGRAGSGASDRTASGKGVPPGDDDDPKPGPPNVTFWYVLPVILVNFTVVSLFMSKIPTLQSTSGKLGPRALTIVGLTSGIQGTTSFLSSPTFGALSDRFGRRMPLLLCLLATSLPYTVLGLTWDIWVYQIMTAALGPFYCAPAIAFAYVGDVTRQRDRGGALGLVIAGYGASMVVGPLAGAEIDKLGPHALALTAMALQAAVTLYILCVMPESLERTKRTRMSLAALNPFTVFRGVAHARQMRVLMSMSFWSNMSEQAVISLVVPYLVSRFSYTESQTTAFIMTLGVLMTVSQGSLKLFLRCANEITLVRVALVFNLCHVTLYALIWQGWQSYVAVSMAPVALLTYPLTTLIVSKSAPAHEQGAWIGAVAGVRSLTDGLGPTLFGFLLTATVHNPAVPKRYSGCAFLAGSLCVAVAIACSAYLRAPEVARAQAGGGRDSHSGAGGLAVTLDEPVAAGPAAEAGVEEALLNKRASAGGYGS